MPGQQEPPSPPLPKSGASPGGSSGSGGSYSTSSSGAGVSSSTTAPPPSGSTLDVDRSARFTSLGYQNITKLREEAARYERMAFKERARSAKFNTVMEKHRHRATVYREKEQSTLGKIPDLETEQQEQQKLLQMGASGTATGAVQPHEQSKIHVRIRKLQQKMANLQRRAKTLEHKAAHHLQIASQKKVLSDAAIEKAKQWEAEARQYTLMADRMQKATEPESLAPNLGR